MNYTTNKNLAKPTENETYDLATVNENMDKIDAALKTNDDAISQLTEKLTNTHVSYYGLISGKDVTSTSSTDYELQNGRKFSNYEGLINVLFMPTGSGYIRTCGSIPTPQFINFRTIEFSFNTSIGQQWVDVIYVSDTKVSVEASIPGQIWINAIDTEIIKI